MARTFEERDGKPNVVDHGGINLGIAVDIEKKDGSRSLMVPRVLGASEPRLPVLPRVLRGPDPEDPREQAHRRRLPRHQHHPDQPGRPRHRRLGPAPDGRPGHDRRHRLDRLPARVGAFAAGQAAGARRLEGDDDDVHLRPPDHPGRRVGLVPAPDRPAPPGRRRILREGRRRARPRPEHRHQRPSRLGLRAAAGQPTAAPARPSVTGAVDEEHAAGGAGGDLAAQGVPDPRPPRRTSEPARRGRQGRPGARAREPQPDPGPDGPDPRLDPADRGRGRDPARRAAADARRLLRHDRLPDRAPLLPPAADVAAGDDRDRHPPRAARARREAQPAAPADRGLPVRALHPEGLPGPEDVLDRGARRDRADDRRDGDAREARTAPSRS